MLKNRLAATDFSYSDPVPNFDRSKVKGLVANLIDLDASNFKSSTALEICAGGKLYNVVVEDEKVGSQLLERGKLRKRVTIIPLNRINAFRMSAEVSLRGSIKTAGELPCLVADMVENRSRQVACPRKSQPRTRPDRIPRGRVGRHVVRVRRRIHLCR